VINTALKWKLDKRHYRVIHNVTLPTQTGTTQIDHIIVSTFGIFVVETKNMTGWIFGSAEQRQWMQRFYRKSFKFQNPIHQNFKHVKTLESLLNTPLETIHSVVAFTGNSTFKTTMPENVTRGIGVVDYIQTFTQPVFSAEELKNLVEIIQSGMLGRSFKTNRDHIKHIQRKLTTEKTKTPIH